MTSSFPLPSDLATRIGHTPLYRLGKTLDPNHGTLYVKMECCNPSGSVKDRAMAHIFACEARKNSLSSYKDSVIASRGSGALSFALFCRHYGLNPVIFSPDSISISKLDLLKKLGAAIYLSSADHSISDPDHYINQAKLFSEKNPDHFAINIHDNYRNPEAYYLNLGPEIWEATGGKIDYLISGASTGGAISGTSRYLKEKKKTIKTILADPPGSLFGYYFQKGLLPEAGSHASLSHLPIPAYLGKAIDFTVIDEVMAITSEEIDLAQRALLQQEGIIVGFGSALALASAIKQSLRLKRGASIVALMRDSYFP